MLSVALFSVPGIVVEGAADLWEGINLDGGDSRCLRQSSLPGFSLGTEAGNCSEGCKFVRGTSGLEECRAIILASGCSSHFSYRASDGQCWGKAVGWAPRVDAGMTSGPVGNTALDIDSKVRIGLK